MMRVVVLAVVLVTVPGCQERASASRYSEPPAQVRASFAHFADSVSRRLATVLDSAGYHGAFVDHDSIAPIKAQVRLAQVSEEEALAGLYEASLDFAIHWHDRLRPTLTNPENLFLD